MKTTRYYGNGCYLLDVGINNTAGKETVKLYNTMKTAAKVYPKIVCSNVFGLNSKAQATIVVNPAVSNFTFTNPTRRVICGHYRGRIVG